MDRFYIWLRSDHKAGLQMWFWMFGAARMATCSLYTFYSHFSFNFLFSICVPGSLVMKTNRMVMEHFTYYTSFTVMENKAIDALLKVDEEGRKSGYKLV